MNPAANFEMRKRARLTDNKFWFSTSQASNFKTLIEALKDPLSDANLIVSSSGIFLVGMNELDTFGVQLFLDANKIRETGEFFCEDTINIGIDIKHLYIFLKTVDTKDILTLYISRKDEDHYYIRLDNQDKNTSAIHRLNILDLELPENYLQVIKNFTENKRPPYSCWKTMQSSLFQKVIKNMINISTHCSIINSGDQLTFEADGMVGKYKLNIYSASENEEQNVEQPDKIIAARFLLRNLSNMVKATNLSPTILLGLGENMALYLEFCVGSLGQLVFLFSQNIEHVE